MDNVLKEVNIGDALGVKGKSVINLAMSSYISRNYAKKIIRERKEIEAKFKDAKAKAAKHSIEGIGKDETEVVNQTRLLIKHSAGLFLNSAIQLKHEFEIIKHISDTIQKLKEVISVEDNEHKKIENLEEQLRGDINFGEKELKLVLTELFELEAEAKRRGEGIGVRFLLKTPTLDIAQKWKMRGEIKGMAKDTKRLEKDEGKIETLIHDIEKIRKSAEKGRMHVKDNFQKSLKADERSIESLLQDVINRSRDEIKVSYELAMNDWINLHVIVGLIKENVRWSETIERNFEIPRQMAEIIVRNSETLLSSLEHEFHHQQIIVDQLYAEARKTESALKR